MFETDLDKQENGIGFDWHHYIDVIEARKKQGLEITDTNQDYDHHLIGKKVRYRDGMIYNVQSCKKQWHLGWYYALLIERNDSHSVLYMQCEDKPTCSDLWLNIIKDHNKNFTIL